MKKITLWERVGNMNIPRPSLLQTCKIPLHLSEIRNTITLILDSMMMEKLIDTNDLDIITADVRDQLENVKAYEGVHYKEEELKVEIKNYLENVYSFETMSIEDRIDARGW